jgi:hypothetical protein
MPNSPEHQSHPRQGHLMAVHGRNAEALGAEPEEEPGRNAEALGAEPEEEPGRNAKALGAEPDARVGEKNYSSACLHAFHGAYALVHQGGGLQQRRQRLQQRRQRLEDRP